MESNSTLDISDSSPLNIPMWYHITYSLLSPQAPRRCLSKFHALCSPLCPQLHKPPHPIALLVLSSCSLGNALIYTAAAAPTFIIIATPPSFPPLPPPQRHHAATRLAHRPAMTYAGAPRCTGRRHDVMEKGLDGKQHCHFGAERVCSPS